MAQGDDDNTASPGPQPENLRAEYSQAASAFGSLANIRFTLLGLLPVGTGATVGVVLANSTLVAMGVIGVFGLVVTVALFIYNERNDQHYGELAGRAAYLERALGIKDGSFGDRPGRWLKTLGVSVEHGWPLKLIYGASTTAWLYLALLPLVTWTDEQFFTPSLVNNPLFALFPFLFENPLRSSPTDHLISLVIAGSFIWGVNKIRKEKTKERREQTRKAAGKAVIELRKFTVVKLRQYVLNMIDKLNTPKKEGKSAEEFKISPNDFGKLLGHLLCLASTKSKPNPVDKDYRPILLKLKFYLADAANGNASKGSDKIGSAAFYWDIPTLNKELPPVAAAQLIALVTNMSFRWIFETYSGKTGKFDRENPDSTGEK